MSFDLATFLKNNLISGFQAGTFDEYQINIFSANYLMKGQISQADFDEIQLVLYPPEPEEL